VKPPSFISEGTAKEKVITVGKLMLRESSKCQKQMKKK
jgi:hypothetical protein